MAKKRRVDLRKILANPDLRRELMVPTIQATQAREGIETTRSQAERAYYVVTEGERTAFFDLEQFRGWKGEPDRRHEMFIRSLRDEIENVRFDVARRDFGAIQGSPLAYRRVGLLAHIFREAPPLEPAWGIARQGKATSDSNRWLRYRWEVSEGWATYVKTDHFSRFYTPFDIVIDWRPEHRMLLSQDGNGLPNQQYYMKAGLTWTFRSQKGFNVRLMPEGCVFSQNGMAIITNSTEDIGYLLGLANSRTFEFILGTLISFGAYEAGVLKRIPIEDPGHERRKAIASIAFSIHDAKAQWDQGAETSSKFHVPWILDNNYVEGAGSIQERLAMLELVEQGGDDRIQSLYKALNDEVYVLYGIPESTRKIIEETLGKRPPEVLWPQMEGKSAEQKRMEHIWRLLSYAVKRVIEADEDGIVPFGRIAGEPGLVDRVRQELGTLFPGRDINQIEVEIVNELKRGVKGYRRCGGLSEWLGNVFFEYHCSLYKNRPIFWHVASAQGTSPFAFGALVHYQRFDKNRMAKMRGTYLRDAIEGFRREAGLADKEGRTEDRMEWQAKVEETQTLDQKLQRIQEGYHEGPDGGDRDFRILTPWKEPDKRPKGWDPDIDDGVKVNIAPFEKAGVLRVA
jgi:hypothetical protein